MVDGEKKKRCSTLSYALEISVNGVICMFVVLFKSLHTVLSL